LGAGSLVLFSLQRSRGLHCKPLWVGFGCVIEVLDTRLDEVIDAGENAAPKPPFGEISEDALDEIQPRRAGGHEMQLEAWMGIVPSPHADRGVLTSCRAAGAGPGTWALAIEFARNAQELLMTVPRRALPDHSPS